MVPEHLKYLSSHEWCKIENTHVTIGVTEHGLKNLGNLIYIELPEVGDDVLVEIPFGEIEGVRLIKDLVSPVDGTVEQVNTAAAHNPQEVLKDPYEAGWLIRVKVVSPISSDDLLSAAEYEQLLRKRKR